MFMSASYWADLWYELSLYFSSSSNLAWMVIGIICAILPVCSMWMAPRQLLLTLSPLLVLLGLISEMPASMAAPLSDATSKKGYWWYEKPAEEENEFPEVEKPVIPPMDVLERMHPDDVGKLMDDQLSYAIVDQSTEAVADYKRLVDFVRRQSRAFSAISSVALLQEPDLNPRTDYPTTNPGRIAVNAQREGERKNRLYKERNEFALLMFTTPGCSFCVSQWQTLQYFAKNTGWSIRQVDIASNQDKAARFGVGSAPVTVIIRRNSDQWANVAVGAESLPAVEENVYRSIRLLKGEIDPSQFFNGEADDGGFFDPEAF